MIDLDKILGPIVDEEAGVEVKLKIKKEEEEHVND